jgi:hypothetical protein
MPRNITVTFDDGTSHVYQNAPDTLTPDMVQARAQQDFGKVVKSLDGGRAAAPAQPKERGILETIGAPIEAISQGVISGGGNVVLGGQRLLGMGLEKIGATDTGKFLQADAARRLAQSQATVAPFKQEFPVFTGAGELGAEILGTAPIGGGLATGLTKFIPATAPLAQAIRTGGFSTGRAVQGAPLATRAGDLGIRTAGGAALGGATSAVINPDDAELGAIIGGAVPLAGPIAGPALGYVGGKIANLRTMPQNRAASLAQQAAGTDLKEMANALRNAPPGVGVAQVLAKFENPTLQALVKDSLESTPEGAQYLSKLGTMTEREAVNELAKLAGGKTATDVRNTLAAAKNAARAITTPMRDTALARGNLGKEVARLESMSAELGEQAAAKVQEVRRLIDLGDHAAAAARLKTITAGLPASSRLAPAKSQAGFSDEFAAKFFYPGKLAEMSDEWASQAANASLDLGQGSRFAQAAADALRKSGIQPLRGDVLVSNIANIGNKPEFAGNDLLMGALRNVSDDISKWTNSGGVIDLVALDAIRKNSVNAAIQQLRPGMDAASQRNAAAGVLSRIKPVIDDAIETAGGTGYRDYLKKHAELSQKIAQKELTGEALKLWKKDKDAFVRLVQNESDDVVEKILGPGKYNIAVELADSTMDTLRKQATAHLDRLSASKQATDGQKALATLVAQNTSMLRFPSLVNAWIAAGNKTISELEKRLGIKTTKALSDAMQDPQTAANLLEALPQSERNKIVQLLNNPSMLGTKGAAVTRAAAMPTNALAPQSENQNALAR